MIKIYVGDVTDETRQKALEDSKDAALITAENYSNLQSDRVYYLSLGDMDGIDQFVDTLYQADELIYVPPEQWSDAKDNYSSMQYWTEFYIRFFRDKKNVKSCIDLHKNHNFLDLIDNRKSGSSQLWIAGCSISHGFGVDPDKRYGKLIADRLDLPVSFLTCNGSSIEWAADQITRSDIRKGDIVVWGITSVSRFPYYCNSSVQHVNVQYYKKYPEFDNMISIDRLSEEDLIYRGVTSLHRVLNFCAKVGAKIYFAGILVDASFIPYLMDLPNYTQLYGYPNINTNNLFLDFGTDNAHPGEITHQWYADTLLQKIKI